MSLVTAEQFDKVLKDLFVSSSHRCFSAASTAFFFIILLTHLPPHFSPSEKRINTFIRFPPVYKVKRMMSSTCVCGAGLVSCTGPVVSKLWWCSSSCPSEDVSWGSLCPAVVRLTAGSWVGGQRLKPSWKTSERSAETYPVKSFRWGTALLNRTAQRIGNGSMAEARCFSDSPGQVFLWWR